jgi:hypothetical protein
MVRSQNSPTVQEHLKKRGVRFGRDFALKFNQKPYFNAGIFLDCIRTTLLPYIDILRGLAVLAQEITVLLMAHCSADVSDHVIRRLIEFEFDTRRESYELLFDEVKLRESAGFDELCSVTFP